MPVSDFMPVDEAARELGVNQARVRAMLASGVLQGNKLGGRWLVESESIRRRQRQRHGRGRQLSPSKAWALLFLASGEDAPALPRWERERLLFMLNERGLERLQDRLHQRASLHRFNAHPGVLSHLADNQSLVLSGISAASAHGLGLQSGQEVDAYLSSVDLPDIVAEFALAQPIAVPVNVKLREIPSGVWPFEERLAPLAAVALDLAQEPDARSARIGLGAIRELDKRNAWRRSS